MKLCPDAGSQAARGQSRPCYRANRGIGKGTGEEQAVFCEFRDVRSLDSVVVEKFEVMLRVVLGNNPDDVGLFGCCGGGKEAGKR